VQGKNIFELLPYCTLSQLVKLVRIYHKDRDVCDIVEDMRTQESHQLEKLVSAYEFGEKFKMLQLNLDWLIVPRF
jgi:SAM-dependent MidA family methyltransferase